MAMNVEQYHEALKAKGIDIPEGATKAVMQDLIDADDSAKAEAALAIPAAVPETPATHDLLGVVAEEDIKTAAARQEARDKVTADQVADQKSNEEQMAEAAAKIEQSQKEEAEAAAKRQKNRAAAAAKGEKVIEKKIKAAKKVRVEAEATIAANQVMRQAALAARLENRAGKDRFHLTLEQQVVEDELNEELRDLNLIIKTAKDLLG